LIPKHQNSKVEGGEKLKLDLALEKSRVYTDHMSATFEFLNDYNIIFYQECNMAHFVFVLSISLECFGCETLPLVTIS